MCYKKMISQITINGKTASKTRKRPKPSTQKPMLEHENNGKSVGDQLI